MANALLFLSYRATIINQQIKLNLYLEFLVLLRCGIRKGCPHLPGVCLTQGGQRLGWPSPGGRRVRTNRPAWRSVLPSSPGCALTNSHQPAWSFPRHKKHDWKPEQKLTAHGASSEVPTSRGSYSESGSPPHLSAMSPPCPVHSLPALSCFPISHSSTVAHRQLFPWAPLDLNFFSNKPSLTPSLFTEDSACGNPAPLPNGAIRVLPTVMLWPVALPLLHKYLGCSWGLSAGPILFSQLRAPEENSHIQNSPILAASRINKRCK